MLDQQQKIKDVMARK